MRSARFAMLTIGLFVGCRATVPTVMVDGGPANDPVVGVDTGAFATAASFGNYGENLPPPVQLATFEPATNNEFAAPPEIVHLPSPYPATRQGVGDYEEMAMAHNPSLQQAVARLAALRGKWVQVGLPPNPVVGYLAQEMGNEGAAGQQGAYVGRQFIRGGKLEWNQAVVAEEIERGEQQLAAQQQRVLTDVRTSYVDFLIAQRRSELAEELVKISTKAVRDTNELLRKGEVKRADALRAEAEAATINVMLLNAGSQRLTAWRRLAVVVGLPELEMPTLTGDTLRQRIDEASQINIQRESAIHQLLSQSPEIATTFTNVERARWALRRAHAQAIPNVNTQLSVSYDDATGDTVTGLQVGMPIPYRNWNQGGIRQAEANVVAAERAVDLVELRLRRRFEQVFLRYSTARNQVEEYGRTPGGILDKTDETLRLTTIGYQAEEFTSLDMLTAQRIYNQAHLTYLDALRELWVAAIEIEGLLLKGSLEAAPE